MVLVLSGLLQLRLLLEGSDLELGGVLLQHVLVVVLRDIC